MLSSQPSSTTRERIGCLVRHLEYAYETVGTLPVVKAVASQTPSVTTTPP